MGSLPACMRKIYIYQFAWTREISVCEVTVKYRSKIIESEFTRKND